MEGRIKNHLLTIVIVLPVLLAVPQWAAAKPIWTDVPVVAAQAKGVGASVSRFSRVRRVAADDVLLRSALARAPMERTQSQREQIQLPMPDGSLLLFNVEESPIMAPEIASEYPNFKSYRARAANNPSIAGRLDYSPKGFHGMIQTSEGTVFIDPATSSLTDQYVSYYKSDVIRESSQTFSCGVAAKGTALNVSSIRPVSEFNYLAKTTDELRTYRLAVAATVEYSAAVAPGSADVIGDTQVEIQTAINRVNQIFERDLAIRLVLVVDDALISTNSGELANDNPALLIDQAKFFIDSAIGAGAYDIGHIFSTGGGGLAGLGVVCDSSTKAEGVTGITNPVSEVFYIDFVAHEIGHQFGANHSFNGTTASCGSGNRHASTAFEPGSGTTIMAYAGICGAENLKNAADAIFHAGSIEQIIDYIRTGAGNTCDNKTSPLPTNTAPDVDPLVGYTIPGGTAFALSGSAIDPEGDSMTYQWDEMDAGSSTNSTTYGSDLVSNALFKSFLPSSNSTRTFPQILTLLSGVPDKAETLPTENRTLNFRLTVRDDKRGVNEADTQIVVDGESGPFEVLQPNSAVTLNTLTDQVIEWNRACTDQMPVNCANVDILLSTDGGTTYSSLTSVPNNGEANVSLPSSTSSTARIKIACTDNIFFDISDTDFALANDGSGVVLMSTGLGESLNCGTAIFNEDVEPNDNSVQAQALTLPVSINGTVNNITDMDDYFVFVTTESIYTFTLSNYSTNDLDLLLFNSDGVTLVSESASANKSTENISLGLAVGKTYYIVVEGFDTFDADSAYTLNIVSGKATTASSGGGGSGGGGGGGGGGAITRWLPGLLLIVFLLRVTPNLRRRFIHQDCILK